MQVQPIAQSTGFKGRRDNVDAVINLDDRTIQQVSYMKALSDTNDNKHRKISKAMFYSIPLVAGLAATVLTRGKATFFSKELTGTAAKFANGLKSAGYWAAGIGAVSAASYAERKLAQKSDTVGNFKEKHPGLSFVATVAAALGIVIAAPKAYNKFTKLFSQKQKFNMNKALVKTADKINGNKFIKGAVSNLTKLESKTPSAIRNIGATALYWAPEAMLLGGVIHSCNHAAVRDREYINTYNDAKHRQLDLSKARLRELSRSNVALVNENKELSSQNNMLADEVKAKEIVQELPAQVQAEQAAETSAVIEAKVEEQIAEKVENAINDAVEAIQEAQEAVKEG